MIVPTGSAFLATSTLGPIGTAGAAAACCAPAPANMFLAMTAVTTAMTSAPTSSATFFTSMAKSPPPCGPLEQPHTSDKLVKKPLGENRREHEKCTRGDRHPIWNFRTALVPPGAVPDEDADGEHAARDRHPREEFDRRARREPQCQGSSELDVAAAHHAGVESAGQHCEDDSPPRQLNGHSGPRA